MTAARTNRKRLRKSKQAAERRLLSLGSPRSILPGLRHLAVLKQDVGIGSTALVAPNDGFLAAGGARRRFAEQGLDELAAASNLYLLESLRADFAFTALEPATRMNDARAGGEQQRQAEGGDGFHLQVWGMGRARYAAVLQ